MKCPINEVIFVSKTEHLYSFSECDEDGSVVFNTDVASSLNHCNGYDEICKYYKTECNGKKECHVRVLKKSHKVGVFGGNCDFVSNFVNVFYTCVPSKYPWYFYLNSSVT